MNRVEQLSRPRTVVLGGGGGASIVGGGMVEAMPDVHTTIVVGEADSGSSTGALARQYGTLPMGDVRRNVAAVGQPGVGSFLDYRFGPSDTLETANEVANEMATRMMRISGVSELDASMAAQQSMRIARGVPQLAGHTLGNFMFTAYAVDEGLMPATQRISGLVGARARVLPVTDMPHDLVMHDGQQVIRGEAAIDEHYVTDTTKAFVWLDPRPTIHPDAAEAIAEANLAIISPGSRNTSTAAVLAVNGMTDALSRQRENGELVAVTNLVNPENDSREWCVGRYVAGLERYLGGRPLDAVIYNNDLESLPDHTEPVRIDLAFLSALSVRSIGAPLVGPQAIKNPNDTIKRSEVRHNIATLMSLFNTHFLSGIAARQPIPA